MKVCIVQPPYTTDWSRSGEYFDWEMEAFDKCDESLDLIVFPESCDVPCMAHTKEEMETSIERYFKPLLEKACRTAERCHAVVFFNAHDKREDGYYNTTFAIDRTGRVVGKYDKQHLTPGESAKYGLVSDYTYEHTEPTLIEIEGVRYAFLTCYDFYFYEAFPVIARLYPDVIIGCSHQRSDRQSALETINRFAAYNCNAWMVRASVSMGEDSDIGGGSCVVAPDGEVLLDMKSRTGLETVEIDPSVKYYKPAGFGNPPAAHHEYIELGRRPWKYRAAGSATVRSDASAPYPRVCALRGFSATAPENSLPALAAASAMGAQEIFLDVVLDSDGEWVVRPALFSDSRYEGIEDTPLATVLGKLSCHSIMALSIEMGTDEASLSRLSRLLKEYDCEAWVYIVSESDELLRLCQRVMPKLALALSADRTEGLIERAEELLCKKVFLPSSLVTESFITDAHSRGVRCAAVLENGVEEIKDLIAAGVDALVTPDVARALKMI